MKAASVDNPEIKKIMDLLVSNKVKPEAADLLSQQIYNSAIQACEINDSTTDFDTWFKERFTFQLVWLGDDDYLRALVRALWLIPQFASTDFGRSRQRDMAQVWTDTSRGFLGEIAFSNFLYNKFQLEAKPDTGRGELSEFLPTDIALIRKCPNDSWREPYKKISIKTTKFNGRWLDVPGAQIEHSDIFVLVKIGILRHHFIAFLKAVSFLKDKLIPKAVSIGELEKDLGQKLWEEIPLFDPIPAYIAGYLDKSELNLPIHMKEYKIKGKKHKSVAIVKGIGIFSVSNLQKIIDEEIIEKKIIGREENFSIEIEPIIKSLSPNEQHFLAHSGGLKWGVKDWDGLIQQL